jgi:CIC family chloride channel protein
MHRLHNYPDVQVMFRRLLIATLVGMLAALAVACFIARWRSWKAVSQRS